MINTITITTLVGLVLAAYGWIFRAITKGINKRMEKIELKQDKYELKQEQNDVIFLKIETSLARIQADLEWLKKQK